MTTSTVMDTVMGMSGKARSIVLRRPRRRLLPTSMDTMDVGIGLLLLRHLRRGPGSTAMTTMVTSMSIITTTITLTRGMGTMATRTRRMSTRRTRRLR